MGQVCHSGDFPTGKYRVAVLMLEAGKWLEIEDLEWREIMEKEAMLAHPYLQMYKLEGTVGGKCKVDCE
jgi:ubiquitin C-terminal hydrolase